MDGRRERGRAGGAATTELFSGFFLALSPDLVYFHKDEIIKVWDCVSECYRQDLLLKKRVGLMGLGTIHIMKRPIWHGEGEGFMADSPEFDLNNPLLVGKKLVHGKSPVPGLSKADELVCAEVALRLHKPKATIVMCIKATLRICEWALSSGQNFDFVFRDIGVLVCRGHHVSMRFFEGLVRDVAQSQHLADGLLQSPNLKPLFIAHTEKDISQIPPGGVFVLPHFVQADGKSQPHPVSAFLQDTGTRETNTKRQTLGNPPSPHLLLRPHLSPSRIYDVKVKGREKKRADSGVQRGSLLPPVENSVKKGRASKGMEEPKARLAASTIQGKPVQQLPPRAEQRSLKKAAAFSPGRFERLRKERVAAVAGVAAALSPEGRKEKKTPSPRRRTPEPRSPRAKQVLLNLQPYKAAREQCMKALQINKLRKWSNAGSLAPGSKLSLVKKREVHEETTAELEHGGSYVAP